MEAVLSAESDVQFLHGMLEGMANIEARAYSLLTELGAAPLTKVSNLQIMNPIHLYVVYSRHMLARLLVGLMEHVDAVQVTHTLLEHERLHPTLLP